MQQLGQALARYGPVRVMAVDHEGMPMPYPAVPVWMGMRFRSLPPFMLVLMVFVMHMQVVVLERVVCVFEFVGVLRGPNQKSCECGAERDNPQHAEGRCQSECTPEPAGQRIGHEPTGMRQRELRREIGGPVSFPG